MIHDIISFSTVFITFIFLILYYLKNDDIYLLGIIGSVLCILLTHFLKNKVFSTYSRPMGAKNCNIFNNDGLVQDEPGFPSGHLSTTTFFVFFFIFILYKHKNKNLLFFSSLLLIYLILMSFARYSKRCHNLPQIFGGITLGGLITILMILLHNFLRIKSN